MNTKSEKAVPTFFAASDYNRSALSHATVPADGQQRIAEYTNESNGFGGLIAELCCGGAWYSIRLSHLLSGDGHFALVDNYPSQLRLANENVRLYANGHAQFCFYQADARCVPLQTGSCSTVLLSFAYHLFDSAGHAEVLQEVKRILSPDGKFFLLTFRPESLRRTLFHAYIDGYWEIDSKRYATKNKIGLEADEAGLEIRDAVDFSYRESYASVENFMDFVATQPFSTFAILQARLGAMYASIIDKCAQELRRRFGAGEVINDSSVTLYELRRTNVA